MRLCSFKCFFISSACLISASRSVTSTGSWSAHSVAIPASRSSLATFSRNSASITFCLSCSLSSRVDSFSSAATISAFSLAIVLLNLLRSLSIAFSSALMAISRSACSPRSLLSYDSLKDFARAIMPLLSLIFPAHDIYHRVNSPPTCQPGTRSEYLVRFPINARCYFLTVSWLSVCSLW